MLKVSPRKGVIRFVKSGKSFNPGTLDFQYLERIAGDIKLETSEELSNIHSTFYVSNLKKCFSDESLVIPMKELRLDDKLNFVEEPVKIMDREQFWATAKAKTVNGEVQLQALVGGKKIVITKSTVRRDLQLEDAEGVDYEIVYKERDDSLMRATTTASSLEAEQDSDVVKTVDEEMTLAQTFMEIKSTKPKAKGIVMEEPNESTATISLQQPSKDKGQRSKVKGKANMIEPKKPVKKKDQIKFDEGLAFKLQAEEEEEAMLARKREQKEEEANIALINTWDNIQARIDADGELAARLQAQEQEELTDQEKASTTLRS
ncbi:hypothetical protein Tco_0065949 [Tanacetum coccineum]